MQRKGQSAVELTMVIGMAMILASPFIISSQSSIVDMQTTSQFLNLDSSLDRVKQASKDLHESSYPARRSIQFQTTESVINVYNPRFEDSSALVFEARYRGTRTNHSVVFDHDFRLVNGSNLSQEGVHQVSLKKRVNSGINMSVVS